MSSQVKEIRNQWTNREAQAETLIPLIGSLYRDNNVVTSIHGRSLINKSAIDLIKLHRFARQIDEIELPIADTLTFVSLLSKLDLGAASLDIAQLISKFKESDFAEPEEFLGSELADIVGKRGADERTSTDVVLYGFGRIGRLVARVLIEKAGGGSGANLRAVVVRNGGKDDLIKRASLLRRDSVHGAFNGTIVVDHENNVLQANGTHIQFIYANDPADIDYTQYGINNAVVVDNTGRWRDEEGLSQHLQSPGVSRVLLTAPGKGDLKNIVYGINNNTITEDDAIVTAASCTTNAITPVLKAVHDQFGIEHGHVETVHSYTNDQNLIDNFHSGDRRGRSAPLNMVLTETGAAKAVAKALPEMAGKLTGNSIRVPTPDVSMAILNLTLGEEVTKEALNTYLRRMSLNSPLRKQIDYISSAEIVSTDFVGSRRTGIVDGLATIADGKHAVLYVWYDNEFGYSCQVVRILEDMAHVHAKAYPATL